ncbi:DUF4113 domain-containing protein [Pseudomonas sp. o96-267]|uniref:DUF4113 domain-containing protein n=1 Tax=Pseudomonas sp. o96-267 TaxID=2479853 RepID=UPI000F76E29A|nr:DUF4113 domain-containing protein [Pseudomonas sp. o96-267]RRV32168.1 DUF4113 domain-containing protein [Pseudomonas sp. o96-267]
MAVVAQINDHEGRGTLRIGRVSAKPVWAMRRQMLSQRFTTRWDEVIGVRGYSIHPHAVQTRYSFKYSP